MHAINLTKAWQIKRLGLSLVTATRRFNSPTGLLSGQDLWLELVRNTDFDLQKFEINGVDLPVIDGDMRWKLDHLLSHNELRLEGSIPIEQPQLRPTDMSTWFTIELQIMEET
jgi:hypothetical protein